MKRYLQNQKGSTMVLALLTMVFLTITLSGLIPFVNSQVLHSSLNADVIEAQYAAEAGAKRAIVGIRNNRQDWLWSIGNPHNIFVDGTAKYYTTSINPEIADNTSPAGNITYTITSTGYVGNAHKRVVVTVRAATTETTNNVFNYATFSQRNMVINSPKITGDIGSNGYITVNSHTANTVTGTAYCGDGNYTIYAPVAVGSGFKVPDVVGNLSVENLMLDMPSITKSGTDIRSTWKNGEWSGDIYPLVSGAYYYDGSYGMYSHSYSVTAGQSVTIYVNGDFNIGKNITGGNVTIYATGNITLNGGSVQASAGGTVNIYANKVLSLNSGSSITGSTVTVLATNAINFNGGSINSTLPGSVSKVYTNGNVALNDTSVIAGQGTGMLVAAGKIDLNGGTAAQTVIIAGGDVNGNSGSKVASIYAGGALNMNGATATYNKAVIQSLGLPLGNATPFSIVSWGN